MAHKVKLISNYAGGDGCFPPGTVKEFPEEKAQDLIAGGYAISMEAAKRETAATTKPGVKSFSKMTVKELQAEAKDRGLPTGGRKADLVEALANAETPADDVEEVQDEDETEETEGDDAEETPAEEKA